MSPALRARPPFTAQVRNFAAAALASLRATRTAAPAETTAPKRAITVQTASARAEAPTPCVRERVVPRAAPFWLTIPITAVPAVSSFLKSQIPACICSAASATTEPQKSSARKAGSTPIKTLTMAAKKKRPLDAETASSKRAKFVTETTSTVNRAAL